MRSTNRKAYSLIPSLEHSSPRTGNMNVVVWCLHAHVRVVAVHAHAGVHVAAGAAGTWGPGAGCTACCASKKQPCILRVSGEAVPALVPARTRCPQPLWT